ncbi:LCP family protein [bacterium]|nr:LCP family protein [bacterium]
MIIQTVDTTEENKKVSRKKRTVQQQPKREEKKKKSGSVGKIIGIFVVLIILGIIGYAGYFVIKTYSAGKKMGFKFTPTDIIMDKEPELKKDSTGKYTNVLVVGVDTREGTALLNTDTIILVSYNYDTNNIVMISIPRDFHVETYKGSNWYQRINASYMTAEQRKEGTGMQELMRTVTEVTGQEIQYYAMFDFQAFTEIVDTIGGIEVDVENSFTDYNYPTEDYGYQTISFKAGPQTMNGDLALKYARSRHSTDNGEGSDFSRAKRQQKVIQAVEDKIMSSSTLTDPSAILSIRSSVADNVRVSEFTIDDIRAALNLGNDYKEGSGSMYSFVLDPYSGGKSLIEVKTMESGAYAIGPIAGFGHYDKIKEYVNLAMESPAFYAEQAEVYVYDIGYGYYDTFAKVQELEKQFKYTDITFLAVLNSGKQGTYVYDPDGTEFKATAEKFTEYFKSQGIQVSETRPDYVSANTGKGHLVILLGEELLETQETEQDTTIDNTQEEDGV